MYKCSFIDYDISIAQFNYEDIEHLIDKDIIFLEIPKFYDTLLQDINVRNEFVKYLYFNKEKIRKRILAALKENSFDAVLIRKLVFFTTMLLADNLTIDKLDSILFNYTNDFEHFLNILFVSKEKISNIISNSLIILNSEKDYFSDEEYTIMLKEEILNGINV